jgi:hypothetical protein
VLAGVIIFQFIQAPSPPQELSQLKKELLFWLKLTVKLEFHIPFVVQEIYQMRKWAIKNLHLPFAENIRLGYMLNHRLGAFSEFKQCSNMVISVKLAVKNGEIFLARRLACENLPCQLSLIGV